MHFGNCKKGSSEKGCGRKRKNCSLRLAKNHPSAGLFVTIPESQLIKIPHWSISTPKVKIEGPTSNWFCNFAKFKLIFIGHHVVHEMNGAVGWNNGKWFRQFLRLGPVCKSTKLWILFVQWFRNWKWRVTTSKSGAFVARWSPVSLSWVRSGTCSVCSPSPSTGSSALTSRSSTRPG